MGHGGGDHGGGGNSSRSSDGDIFQKINALLDNKLDLGNFLGDAPGSGVNHGGGGVAGGGGGRGSSSSLSPNSSVFYPSGTSTRGVGFSASRENVFGLSSLGSGAPGYNPGRGFQVARFQGANVPHVFPFSMLNLPCSLVNSSSRTLAPL